MGYPAGSYRITVVRQLLVAVFTPDTLRTFCQGRAEFQPLLDRFGPGDDLNAMSSQVIDYCQERGLMEQLLDAVRSIDPQVYGRLERALRQPAPGPAPELEARPRPVGPSLGIPDPAPSTAPQPAVEPAAPAAPPLVPAGPAPCRDSSTIERHGRVEYRSPMDLEYVYPLRVGLLLEHHEREVGEEMRVRFGDVRFSAEEPEPVVIVRPCSPFFEVTPQSRRVKLAREQDVYANFELMPVRMPKERGGQCSLHVEFEYDGRVVKCIDLDAEVQHKHQLGPWKIPHAYWSLFGGAGSLIFFLDASFNIFQFTQGVAVSPASLGLTLLGLIAGGGALGLGAALWNRAARRLVQMA